MHATGQSAGDWTLMRAMLANWEGLERAIAERFGGVTVDEPRAFRFRSGLHSGFMNGVVLREIHPDDVDAFAHELRAWFPPELPWRWILPNDPLDVNIGYRLEADGFERRWPDMAAMTVDLAGFDVRDWTPDAGRVTEVLSDDDLEAWLSVRRVNLSLDDQTIAAWRRAHGEFGLGPRSSLRHFVGWQGDKAVAGASLFLDEHSGTAGITTWTCWARRAAVGLARPSPHPRLRPPVSTSTNSAS